MTHRAIVVALSPIAQDTRVLRHCRALNRAGFEVTTIGLQSQNEAQVLQENGISRLIGVSGGVWNAAARTAIALGLTAFRMRSTDAMAKSAIECLPGVKELTHALVDAAAPADPAKTIVVANDWTALPGALAVNAARRIPFHYDTHEFAVEEHAHRRRWQLLFPPLIDSWERRGIAAARSISCVSPGISTAMQQRYALLSAPEVLMSIPDVAPLEPRALGPVVEMLYHGLFLEQRGLEALASSVADWPGGFRLVLRGHSPTNSMAATLERMGARAIATGRLAIEPMVAQTEVITVANRADIGVFLPDTSSRQQRFALPNKLFEYLFAGLVPIVPAGTDMAELLKRLDAGIALPDASPKALAGWLAALTADALVTEKQRVRQAARRLAAEARERTIATLIRPSSSF